ncbi:MAG: hypothetical protein EOO50_16035 [Flavobacterium sp.]|uniref:hypothetical protein n=1 Tax=Flavobacterium sp. TaxID=239 RepID=UPI001221F449|nr:hypothetical protein [Flavobacterium sp.]RZJ64309.1 MAG: hypothetical protein EOO50_16035 [Flavobacterium sp.]
MKNLPIYLALFFVSIAFSQHDHHNMQPKDSMPKMQMDTTKMDHDMTMGNMSHAFSQNLSMNRNGSGTSWLPDASPMYGAMFHAKDWMFMAHGNLFVRYNNQDFASKGSRGDDEFDAPNWLMFMGQRKIGQKGLFHFNTMFSFDALTGGNDGYPLLFQSGEAYRGSALVDRQHPHDLFSELSVSYSYAFTKDMDAFVYVGYPGEPALGAVAFMHRPSALNNPDAPLSHHWVDATHITFGVATIGFRYGEFKVEGSSFTGREPNEHRYDFDKPRFDSYSGRLSFNPDKNWALQVSHGFLKQPEELHPDDVNRTTASATYSLPLADDGWFNATALWGMNKTQGHDGEHAALLEASWNRKKLAVYGRYEFVQKSSEELSLPDAIYGDSVFPVNAVTAGLSYDLYSIGKFKFAAGGQMSFYSTSSRLDGLYGNNPMAFEVYLRVYPSLMKM